MPMSSRYPSRNALHQYYRLSEVDLVKKLAQQLEIQSPVQQKIRQRASELVINIRRDQRLKGGIESILQEFSLSSQEGIVLMCLAEALLRVPDELTMDRLIRDKITGGDWYAHTGRKQSFFVNASAWGLLLTGKFIACLAPSENHKLLQQTLARLGEPVIRASIRFMVRHIGEQFVFGTNIEAALEKARQQQNSDLFSFDILGEGARDMQTADAYFSAYQHAIRQIGLAQRRANIAPERNPGISVKLSALHPRFEYGQQQRIMAELLPRLKSLVLLARDYDLGFTIDAEETNRLELSLELIQVIFLDPDFDHWDGFGMAVQAYQKRALPVIDWAVKLASTGHRKLSIRLVKGAYWDAEIKAAQSSGYDHYPVFTLKAHTDISYITCASRLLACRDTIYPQFATHNASTVATILELDTGPQQRTGYEFQRLYGMGEVLYDQVVAQTGVACRIYAPVGEQVNLLAYLVRRLLENGANSSFVNKLGNESINVDRIIQDPYTIAASCKMCNPSISLPKDLFKDSALENGQRQNSPGVDFSVADTRLRIESSLLQWRADIETVDGRGICYNPADRLEPTGCCVDMEPIEIESKLALLDGALSQWSNLPVANRSQLLRALADQLLVAQDELALLSIKEAGKTIVDSYAEIREAVDFCRYYADRAEELDGLDQSQGRLAQAHPLRALPLRARPLGVVLCISPWNFPIAIFIGQIVAALVTGNTVAAKPAEQTSLIARRLMTLFRTAGFPSDVCQLVVCNGQTAGELLVSDRRISGVMFTGSTATARKISLQLYRSHDAIIPLIAETGGQNVMIVDSTALPEQVVDDVIKSGFYSAGQRCSGLRILCLQAEVAEDIISLLVGAMAELTVGDPKLFSTDIGPVIDQSALVKLQVHQQNLAASNQARLIYQCKLPEIILSGFYFAPALYELESLALLQQEVFGPIVHVVRYQADDLEGLVDRINALEYGLTIALHSRIESCCRLVADRARVGNVYINRNMTGAVVGVQPFGGCGLSGTGPKAGGPNYLPRLTQRTTDCDHLECFEHDIVAGIATQVISAQAIPTATESDRVSAIKELSNPEIPLTDLTDRPGVNDARHETLSAGHHPVPDMPPADLKLRQQLMQRLLACFSHDPQFDGNGDLKSCFNSLCHWTNMHLANPLVLPGPTGEHNLLQYMPRGITAIVLVEGLSAGECLLQLSGAFLAGNPVLLFVDEMEGMQGIEEIQRLQQALIALNIDQYVILQPIWRLKVALQAGNIRTLFLPAQALKLTAPLLGDSTGPLVAVMHGQVTPDTMIRLVTEKTITTNTTAAGGNTALLSMAEADN
ncbi:MAG: bifunctional proline dehydrogenase/L-glutamate gamma-semialdehyde dehydrogenase PutA [Pseudomonadales bacterium]|nr:bifunctional proline dehydrogenase/L-glutamate gamma-semialdehyde dehydrogenase PutA [Pseudomonadales bacterium]